ncbi:uncharacterized protein C8Q71DRAFT_893681 [Rhodofomes roseus]|uniref:Uncharacterized protein n=1 Tax=Rhodofomes roseus TaxID=34475 RepID=A0ABQ8JX63_9APHY|nr:uncharacterized protein C8Q71DRAFT_893681 [Rhodofomes roseus]KAH9828645.1 hypothetical protein C8Q71DRAFT_893681 [Rhodofomes roseus]
MSFSCIAADGDGQLVLVLVHATGYSSGYLFSQPPHQHILPQRSHCLLAPIRAATACPFPLFSHLPSPMLLAARLHEVLQNECKRLAESLRESERKHQNRLPVPHHYDISSRRSPQTSPPQEDMVIVHERAHEQVELPNSLKIDMCGKENIFHISPVAQTQPIAPLTSEISRALSDNIPNSEDEGVRNCSAKAIPIKNGLHRTVLLRLRYEDPMCVLEPSLRLLHRALPDAMLLRLAQLLLAHVHVRRIDARFALRACLRLLKCEHHELDEGYKDDLSSASTDAEGSLDDAPHTSPEPERAGEAEAGGEVDVDGEAGQEHEQGERPYAFRKRNHVNYAIPPPLEGM